MSEASTSEPKAPEASPASTSKTMTSNNGGSTPQTSSSKKENTKSANKSPSLSKTFCHLVHEAIVALKDRTGSSNTAISKWILANYPEADGPQFRSRLNQALKTGVRNERFTKVKASYKISKEWKEKEKARKKKKQKKAVAEAKSPEKTLEETKARNAKKLAELAKTMAPEDLAKEKEKMDKKEQAMKRKAEAELKAKERADRLRKRRYPMEDTKLHQEDKELGVKPPPDVQNRPYLPYFWHVTQSLSDPCREGKTPSRILVPSKVDALDQGRRGLVPDTLQVYHFFRGDVHFMGDSPDFPLVPEFTLQQLIFATEQIQNGNAKSSRMMPPLIVHLFCTCLQLLCQPPDDNVAMTPGERQLRKDLNKFLAPILSPASWADACFLYMDAMERYYCSDLSREPGVIPALNVDIEYLLGIKDEAVVPMTPFPTKKDPNKLSNYPLPDGYHGYLGDEMTSLLRNAHYKLGRMDPWLLSAEEIMTLLRALTDDVLATHPTIGSDLAAREEEMYNLLKAKRSADLHLRKMRLGFEGPKKPAKKEDAKDGEEKASENGEKDEEPFKPTVSKKQFESAKKAQQKASDAYEEGIRRLVARTEPVGYDRNFNAVYCFRHDPEVLYVEDVRPPTANISNLPPEMHGTRRSWHVIETTSLFDLFVSSLDIRGKREHDLYEELMGPAGANQSLRRFLHDDVKEAADKKAWEKERESLTKRLEVARLKCDEEQGRRSGRLVGVAEEELAEAEGKMEKLEKEMASKEKEEDVRDYYELTGMDLLQKFDKFGGKQGRRTREQKENTTAKQFDSLQCSKLVGTGNIDGSGLVGLVVGPILQLEEHCQALAPWEDEGADRKKWISQMESAITAWYAFSPLVLGPYQPSGANDDSSHAADVDSVGSPFIKRASLDSTEASTKRRRLESPMASGVTSSSTSVQSIIQMIKGPLLALEERVANMTNVAIANRDVEIADENMSTDGEDQDQDNKAQLEMAWKKIAHRIRETPAKRHVQIRDMIVSAIAAARKAHLPGIVSELRAALLLYHPNAAGSSKDAVVKTLVAHGDYEEDEDDDESVNDEEKKEEEKEDVPSVVAAEAAVIRSSLGGSEDASRSDWIDAVKASKTISRLAALAAGFVHDANEKVLKMQFEHEDLHEAISKWQKEEERRAKNQGKKSNRGRPAKDFAGPSEVWANVRFTDDICMAKAEDFPWWPAKRCFAKDSGLEESLSKVGRSLVSLVGEMGGLRVVKVADIKPFDGKIVEDESLEECSKETRNQLDDCMAMARRIMRGLEKKEKGCVPMEVTTTN